jgi:hypothetical protein
MSGDSASAPMTPSDTPASASRSPLWRYVDTDLMRALRDGVLHYTVDPQAGQQQRERGK